MAALVVQIPPQPWSKPPVSLVDRLVDRFMTHALGSSDPHR